MKPRRLTLFIFAILLSGGLPLCAQPDPPSTWWYPLGPPEASRTNDVPTGSQQSGDIRIKWRTTELANSPVLLVGAIRREDGATDQQIVGHDIGTLFVSVLTSGGFLDTTFRAADHLITPQSIRLTGLFNASAPSVNPHGRPDLIGIGVEQRAELQQVTPFGLLLNRDGSLRNLLGLRQNDSAQIYSRTEERNRYVTINPIAVFTPTTPGNPIALVLQSQDRFIRNGNERMLNGLRKHTILPNPDLGIAQAHSDSFFVAPKPYSTAPALRLDATLNEHILSLATERYAFTDPIVSFNTDLQEQTVSNEASRLHLLLTLERLENSDGKSNTAATGIDQIGSLFTTLLVSTSGNPVPRPVRIAFDRDESIDSTGPTLLLSNQSTFEAPLPFSDTSSPANQATGFSIIPIDVDGSAPGNGPVLVNNPGRELVVTTLPVPQTTSEHNFIYVFRYSVDNPIGTRAFYYFTRAHIRGSVVAGGDLVDDEFGRQEVVLVWRDSLHILQLRPYAESQFIRNASEPLNQPFLTLARFGLGDSIVSVAIADVENDGENDLVVGTTGATYLIGTPRADAFTFSGESLGRTICPSDTISVRWRRMTVGSGEGIIVRLVGPDGSTIIPSQRVGGDSLRATPMELQIRRSGEYRLVITDALYEYVLSESAPFTISEGSIGELDFNDVTSVTPGEIVRDTIELACVPSLQLQKMSAIGMWVDVEGGVELLDDGRAAIAATIDCSGASDCMPNDGGSRLSFRLVSPVDTGAIRILDLEGGSVPFTIIPGDTSRSRRRTLEWDASDFAPCGRLQLAVSDAEDAVIIATDIDPDAESTTFSVPGSLSDTVAVCLVCAEEDICRTGREVIVVGEIVDGNYIVPNPYDPTSSEGTGIMEIVYRLESDGRVAVDIFDASRTMVRRIVPNQMRTAGDYRDEWDGRNHEGEIVANGTYICVITSSSGETIILPAVVLKQR